MAKQAIQTRITKVAVDKLEAFQVIRDTDLKGFGVRRQAGPPSYFLLKRVDGRLRWMTIGIHGRPWTPETARKEAYRLLGVIASGDNPATLKQERLDNPTLTEAAIQFLEDHGPKLKPNTRTKYEILLRLHIKPALGSRRLVDIKRPDVLRFHSRLSAKASTANYCVAIISKIMSWAEEHGYRAERSNPCLAISKYKEAKRQRYLRSEELERLGRVLAELEALLLENRYVIAAIRLLIFTGARVGEILTLQWSFVDLERRLLLLPDSKTGQKVITLNSAAISVLQSIPRVHDNPYVIVGRYDQSHLINLQKPWRAIRTRAGLPGVRLHDLRHSYASFIAAAGGSLPMIGKLLGHNHAMTTARYVHLTKDPLQELNERVGSQLATVMGASPTDAEVDH